MLLDFFYRGISYALQQCVEVAVRLFVASIAMFIITVDIEKKEGL